MLIQYQILNMCLFQLQRSSLSTVSKLRLEVQLYHLKRLLLMDEVAAIVKDDASSEKEFMSLYEGFKNIANDDSTATDIEGLILQQRILNEVIGSLHGVERCEPSLDGVGAMNASLSAHLGAELACHPAAAHSGSDGEDVI